MDIVVNGVTDRCPRLDVATVESCCAQRCTEESVRLNLKLGAATLLASGALGTGLLSPTLALADEPGLLGSLELTGSSDHGSEEGDEHAGVRVEVLLDEALRLSASTTLGGVSNEASDDAASDDTTSDDTASDDAASDNTASDDTASDDDTVSGDTASDDTTSDDDTVSGDASGGFESTAALGPVGLTVGTVGALRSEGDDDLGQVSQGLDADLRLEQVESGSGGLEGESSQEAASDGGALLDTEEDTSASEQDTDDTPADANDGEEVVEEATEDTRDFIVRNVGPDIDPQQLEAITRGVVALHCMHLDFREDCIVVEPGHAA